MIIIDPNIEDIDISRLTGAFAVRSLEFAQSEGRRIVAIDHEAGLYDNDGDTIYFEYSFRSSLLIGCIFTDDMANTSSSTSWTIRGSRYENGRDRLFDVINEDRGSVSLQRSA